MLHEARNVSGRPPFGSCRLTDGATNEDTIMEADQIAGAAQDFGGKVQDGVGGLIGDTGLQLRGKANQVAGKARESYGRAVDEVTSFAREQPIATLAAAAGVGFGIILGLYLARRQYY
jgi:uncharacterized protein YjbJ (UPF0337 family)